MVIVCVDTDYNGAKVKFPTGKSWTITLGMLLSIFDDNKNLLGDFTKWEYVRLEDDEA
jgi:hypothetical protein